MPETIAAWTASTVISSLGKLVFTSSLAYQTIYAVTWVASVAALSYGINAISADLNSRDHPGSLLETRIQADAPRQLVVGERILAGSRVGLYVTGPGNNNLIEVIAIADHRCEACLEYIANGKTEIVNLVHGVRTTLPNYRSGGDRLWVTWYDGRHDQTADPTLAGYTLANQPDWTADHRGRGVSYAVVEMQWDDDVLLTPVSSQFLMRGGRWYDRREDDTAGGEGDHRHTDPDTWTYTANPDVFADHYQLGIVPYPDATVYQWGIGLKPWQLPFDLFKEEADISEEQVLMADGVTYQDRYQLNAVFSATATHKDILIRAARAKVGRVVDRGGRLAIIGPQARTPVRTIYDSDLVSDQPSTYSDKQSISGLFNEFRGTFPDPEQRYQATDYPPLINADWVEADGGDTLPETVNIDEDTDEERVQRLVWLHANDRRRQARLNEAVGPWCMDIEEGDWFEREGVRFPDGKLFEAIKVEHVYSPEVGMYMLISSKEVDPDDVAWSADMASELSRPPLVSQEASFAVVDAPALTVSAVNITGGGATLPAIGIVVTNPDDPRIRTALIEVVPDGGGPIIQTVIEVGPDAENAVTIDEGILPGTDYVVRAKFQGLIKPSEWSTNEPVTTGSTFNVPTATAASTAIPGSDLDVDLAAVLTAAAAAASSAATAATAAANAAAAETAAEAALTAADAAAAAALASEGLASTYASAAASSASGASGSASAAATSAGAAASSASAASSSASAAQTSEVAARVTVAASLPPTFELDGRFFTADYTNPVGGELSGTFTNVSVEGRALSLTGNGSVANQGLLALRPGRTYSVASRLRILTDQSNGHVAQPLLGIACFDASKTYINGVWINSFVTKTAADGWFNQGGPAHLASYDAIVGYYPTAAYIRLVAVPCWSPTGASNAVSQTVSLSLTDITESAAAAASAAASASSASSAASSQSAAASSASAAATSATNAATQAANAATSASQASTSETNASGSASTASTAATNAAASQSAAAGSATAASGSASTASTQAGNAATSASAALASQTSAAASASAASGSASTASTQASAASASAASAATSATLSATFAAGSQGSINSSATFADNANATGVPTNWYDWSGAAANTTRVTGVAPQPYAITVVGPAGVEVGIGQSLLGRTTSGWHVLEADITLNSGALTGAGVLINWDGGGASISFVADTDINGSVAGAGTAGQTYKFRKLVQIVAGTTYSTLHPMTHWNGFGSYASANSITWHRCAIRAASQAEIEARQAKLDLVTANANIATNAAAVVTANASIATTNATVAANFTALRSGGTAEALPSTFEADDLFWNPVGGYFADVSGTGRVWLGDSLGDSIRSRGRITLRPNRTYRFTARYSVFTNSTSGDNPQPLAGITTYDSTGTNIAGVWVGSFVSRTTADGWVTVTGEYSTATIAGAGPGGGVEMDAYCQPNWHPSASPNAVVAVQFVELKDVTDIVATNASVTTQAAAIAGINGLMTASYAMTLDVNGRISGVKHLNDGTTSSVKYRADTFSIYDGSSDVAMFEVSGGVAYVSGSRVRTESMTSNSVTNAAADVETGSLTITTSWQDAADATVTVVAGFALVRIDWSFAAFLSSSGAGDGELLARILRDGTDISGDLSMAYLNATQSWPIKYSGSISPDDDVEVPEMIKGTFSHLIVDLSASAGSRNYKLQFKKSGSGNMSVGRRVVFAACYAR